MKPIPAIVLFLLFAGGIFGLAHFVSEDFVIDCQRSNAAPANGYHCTVTRQSGGRLTVRELDATTLLSVRLDRESHFDTDMHSYSYTYHFLVRTTSGELRSGRESYREIEEGVKRIEAFRADFRQREARVELNNQTTYYLLAGATVLLVLIVAIWSRF